MAHDDPFAGKTTHADWGYGLDRSGIYTPEIIGTTTNPNLGADGEAVGSWHRSGHLITGWMRFLFSGTGLDAGSGRYSYTLPFPADASIMSASGDTFQDFGAGFLVGVGYIRDESSLSSSRTFVAQLADAGSPSRVKLLLDQSSFEIGSGSGFAAEGDRHAVSFAYIADPTGLPS